MTPDGDFSRMSPSGYMGVAIVDHLRRITPEPPDDVRAGFRAAWKRGYAAAAEGKRRYDAVPYKIGVWRHYYGLGYTAYHEAEAKWRAAELRASLPPEGGNR